MGVKLSEILTSVRTLKVPFGDHTLTVSYKLGDRTGEEADKFKITDDVRDIAVKIVSEWDLLGDNGKPVPITKDGLKKVPLTVVRRVVLAIVGDDGLGEVASSSNDS